ncbi:putative ATP-dependent helicase DinG [wastewater metagenome]|uniref:Putative ATP-dependent helicase DinG n=2 Tax=unclassified sequences TaxID=12908 RepID=A0A5B8R828_9ZZZZ|nr:ATP-dependent DNA helicase [Arhodomonas sp. KWT]QEA05279.1 putative ATP-dependent helicase DinG [uncultured organism]
MIGEHARDALGGDGALARAVDGFSPRGEQQTMAEAVGGVIEEGGVLVAEAGTGTGKTFAYLVPALLSGQKVIVSTGTRTLQDQLYHRDLPLVSRALEHPVRRALLKGRSNYLCLYRMEAAAAEGRFDSREEASRFQRIREWAGQTRSGDLAEAPVAGIEGGLLGKVTSTPDNCLGQECPFHAECHLMEARRRAQEADVVVVNHHLLMADWAVRDGGFGEVLPAADAWILDEAHQLPDTAAQFFGLSVSSRQLVELARDARVEQVREAKEATDIADAAEALQKAVLDFRLTLGSAGRREPWAGIAGEETVTDAVATVRERLAGLHEHLAPHAQRGKGVESVWRRAAELQDALGSFLEGGDDDEQVQWFETHQQSFILRLTPLEVAGTFRKQMAKHPGSWVFTSATLSVGGRFEHYIARLGLGEPQTLRLESPFDYEHNALLYVPGKLPPPNAPDYLERFLVMVEWTLRESRGRAFVLFTSHRALRAAAEYLRERTDHPLLVQGEAAQARLLERFREAGDAVLLGTQSFWEGVDVRGEALSCVIIDRLPFASPSDPVTQARIEALRSGEGNPFAHFQLPQAVIALRQGVGRLIRDASDKGVLVIGDNRVVTKGYGRVFLDSLPPMPLTRSFRQVQAFFAAMGEAAADTDERDSSPA